MSHLGFEPGGGKLTVAGVQPGSAAQKAGLAVGDRLRAIDGIPTDNATAFIAYVKSHAGKPVTLQVERGGHSGGQAAKTFSIVPQSQRDDATRQQIGRIGAELATQVPSIDVRYGPVESLQLGARRTWDLGRLFGAHVRADDCRRSFAEESFWPCDDRRLRRKERTSRSFCIPVVPGPCQY